MATIPSFTDQDECGAKKGQHGTPVGVLDQSNWALDRSMMWQAYRSVICFAEPEP